MPTSPFDVVVVVGQCVWCLVLTGLPLVVQLVVYPGFSTVATTLAWAIPLRSRLTDCFDERAARALLGATGLRLALRMLAGGLSIAMVLEV